MKTNNIYRPVLLITSIFLFASLSFACGSLTTAEIIETETSEGRIRNATATAVARVARGDAAPDTGVNATVEAQRASALATATALALATPTPNPQTDVIQIPEGPAQSGEVVVKIMNRGEFDPPVVKIKPGTTVIWETERRTASTVSAYEGQDEFWDSGPLNKGTFDTEPKRFSYTFTTPGCFRYRSMFPGDVGQGAVCVVE